MCGFIGEISKQLIEKEVFQQLLDYSIKRGPDQQGMWNDQFCQLGFNRLSIVDLSENAKQPLLSPSNKFAMVFNGEVYNYKELKSKFDINDADLRSSSDTEVLAHLIEKIPIDQFAKELNGMFSIVIWNLEEKLAYLIRDFAGIKPLFYGLHSNGIVFASQFNQVFKHPAFNSKELRPEMMKEFFGLGYMHAPNTVFKNIFQVEPGYVLTYNFEKNEIVSNREYYKWETSSNFDEMSEETTTVFSDVFKQTIQSQMQADVPVASFLSSGVDSTLITGFAKKIKNDLVAFTFGVDDPNLNEVAIAELYANELQVSHVVENCDTSELLAIVDSHFKEMPEPFGDHSSIPTYLITKRAKQYATVMLSGDGGDELFWGYPRFIKPVQQGYFFKIPLKIRKILIPLFRKFNKELSSALEVVDSLSNWTLNKQIQFDQLDAMFPNHKLSKELFETYRYTESISKNNTLLYLKKNEFYGHLQRVLKKVDLMSMSNSLEVRVPFLDKRIIDFSNKIEPELGIKHTIPKYILKKELANLIDLEKINLIKKGFSVPYDKWLKNELKDDFIQILLKSKIYGEEFINKQVLESMIHDFYEGNNISPWGLWHFYSWQKWAINNKLV